MSTRFNYEEAFSRTLGWVTEREQQVLRGKRVAVAGMGGVGGAHVMMLARLGIGALTIADPDRFELANFNRQVGAKLPTEGMLKVDVMAREAREINPGLDIRAIAEEVSFDNVDSFLEGVDLFVDGLDFFAFDARIMIFRRCRELGIPAVTAAPIGMGVAHVVFTPRSMSFDEYFGLGDCPLDERAPRFLSGLVPKPLHQGYLVDGSWVALDQKRGPSTPMACQLAASIVGVCAVKVLLDRPDIRPAPHYHLFDGYRSQTANGYLAWGYRHPLQRIKHRIAKHLYARSRAAGRDEQKTSSDPILKILDEARWAPSGDNGQPWRFELKSEKKIIVHVKDEFEHDLYDRDGDFSLISAGCLLENMRLAAASADRAASWQYQRTGPHEHRITVELTPDSAAPRSVLSHFIRARSTDRTPFRAEPLTASEKTALEACVDESLQLTWYESLRDRLEIAFLNALATDIRLRCREAHDVHRRVIDFERAYSPTGIPARATGLDPLVLRVMRWAMKDFGRIDALNAWIGTNAAQLEMDLLPGIMCSAHFMMSFKTMPHGETRGDALLRAGQSIQRFWLEATRMGLAMQPGNAPIIFGSYGERNHRFTEAEPLLSQARRLAERVRAVSHGTPSSQLIFAGRIGRPRSIKAGPRSVRRPLEELIVNAPAVRHGQDREHALELLESEP